MDAPPATTGTEATPFTPASADLLDLQLPKLLHEVRIQPDRDVERIVAGHARELKLQPEDFIRRGVDLGVDVLAWSDQVRQGKDPEELMREAASRRVSGVLSPEQRAREAQRRHVAKERIRTLATDPVIARQLSPEERQTRIRQIMLEMDPATRLVTGADTAQVMKAIRDLPKDVRERGVIPLTNPDLMRAAGFRLLPEAARLGGSALEDVPEVTQGAEAGAVAARQILLAKIKESPSLSRLDRWDDKRFISTRFLQDRINELAAKQGLTPESALARGEDYETARRALAIEAIRDLAMARTAGLWQGPMFLPRDLHVDRDTPLWQLLPSALTPNVEVMGLAPNGDVLFRTESPWEYGFGMLDIPLAATSGALAAATTPGGLEAAGGLARAALAGIKERSSFTEIAMSTPSAQEGKPGALLLGAAGLAADILFPIDTGVLAVKGLARLPIGRTAARLVTQSDRRAASSLLRRVSAEHQAAVAARNAGNAAEAEKHWATAEAAEAEIRRRFPDAHLAGSLDRLDAEVSLASGKGASFLQEASVLPGDLGERFTGAHMADRRRALQLEVGVPQRRVTEAAPGVAEYNPSAALRALDRLDRQLAPMVADSARQRSLAMHDALKALPANATPSMKAWAARNANTAARRAVRQQFVKAIADPPRAVRAALRVARREINPIVRATAAASPHAAALRDIASPQSLAALWADPDAWYVNLLNHANQLSPATKATRAGRVSPMLVIHNALMRVRKIAQLAGDPEYVQSVARRAKDNLVASSESRARAADIAARTIQQGAPYGDPEALRQYATTVKSVGTPQQVEDIARAVPLPVTAAAHGVEGDTFVDTLRTLLQGPGRIRAAARWFAVGVFFGGDAWQALRALPHRLRTQILSGIRLVDHALADSIHLVKIAASDPAVWDTVHRFLDGELVTLPDGRAVTSSGFDCSSAVATTIRAGWTRLPLQHQRLLSTAIGHLQAGRAREALPEEFRQESLVVIAHLLRGGVPGAKQAAPMRFLRDLSEALEGVPKAMPGASDDLTGREIRLVLQTLAWALSPITGGRFRAKNFLGMIEELYGAGDRGRAAILLAGHGHAARARLQWSGLVPGLQGSPLGVPLHEAATFTRWVLGERIRSDEYPLVRSMAARFGMNAHFVREADIPGTHVFIPSAAREALHSAIRRGMEDFEHVGGLQAARDERLLSGVPGAVHRYIKLRQTRGAFMIRPRYYLMNTADHFVQMAMDPDIPLSAAVASTLRILPQTVFTVLPLLPRTLYVGQKVATVAGKLGRPLTSAYGRFATAPSNIERVRQWIQGAGDVAAGAVARLFSGGKFHISVNDVLDGGMTAAAQGRPTQVTLGGRSYSYADLRITAVRWGIFSSFDVSQLTNAIQRTLDAELRRVRQSRLPTHVIDLVKDGLHDLMEFTTEMGEAWGERERLGAMLTLIEHGLAPDDAAALVVRALYDYAGSLSAADRHWLVSLVLPYWAYHKNANTQVINTMLSPRGVWTQGVIRRAYQHGPEYLSDAVYASVYDPYGVDVEALSIEGQATYWTLRHLVENGMGPPETWPPGVREVLEAEAGPFETWSEEAKNFAINGYGGAANVPWLDRLALQRIFLGETAQFVHQGSLYEMAEPLQDIGALPTREGAVPPPDPSARRSYLRGSPGITVPIPPSISPWVKWYYADVGKDYPYVELFLPDHTIQAGMHHVAGMAATYLLMGQFIAGGFGAFDPVDPDTGESAPLGVDAIALRDALFEVLDPARAPLARDVFATAGVSSPPRRVDPWLGRIIDDVFSLGLRPRPGTKAPGAPQQATDLTADSWVLPPGAMSVFFDVTPGLAEINDLLIKLRKTPLEARAEVMGDLMQAARAVGLTVAESNYTRTVQAEAPRFPLHVTTPQPQNPTKE